MGNSTIGQLREVRVEEASHLNPTADNTRLPNECKAEREQARS